MNGLKPLGLEFPAPLRRQVHVDQQLHHSVAATLPLWLATRRIRALPGYRRLRDKDRDAGFLRRNGLRRASRGPFPRSPAFRGCKVCRSSPWDWQLCVRASSQVPVSFNWAAETRCFDMVVMTKRVAA